MARKAQIEDMQAFFAQLQEQAQQKVVYYPLPGLLPDGYRLSLWKELNTIQLLGTDRLLAEEQFTPNEMSILKPIMDSYPHHCPYDVLVAHFTSGDVINDKDVKLAAQHLEEEWAETMKPVRNVLSRVRIKMHTFGLDLNSIFQVGYMIMRSRCARETPHKERLRMS